MTTRPLSRPAALALAFAFAPSVLAPALLGCDDAPAPSSSAPAPTRSTTPRAAAPEQSHDAGTPTAVYSYNPLGKRDPFRDPEIDQGQVQVGTSSNSCQEPLCQWDREQLTLVAVVSGDANPIAMVEDPNGVGHLLRRNTRIGKQGGKVTQVLRDCIIVTEYWAGPDGKVNANPVKTCIKGEDKEPVLATDLLTGTGSGGGGR